MEVKGAAPCSAAKLDFTDAPLFQYQCHARVCEMQGQSVCYRIALVHS